MAGRESCREGEESEIGEEGHQVQTLLLHNFAGGKRHWALDQEGTSVTEQGSWDTAGGRLHALNHAFRSGASPAHTCLGLPSAPLDRPFPDCVPKTL